MNPKISVVVPVYNVERYLEYALNSLVQQTFIDDIEVLMIDDGSTDNSRYIMEKYALDYENFHAYHKENEGLSITRNYGLKLAKGEYVHFMDSDDLMITDAYEKLYNLASKNDSEVVTADFLRFNENNAWIQPISDYIFSELESNIDETNAYKYHKLLWDTPAWNKIFKREFLLENNLEFPNQNIISEDNIFAIQMLTKAKKISILNDYIYCWRKRDVGSSISQADYVNRGRDLYEMAEIDNNILKETIEDKEMLNIKYKKFFFFFFPFYMESIKNYSEENYKYVLEGAYNLVNLVPDEYFEDLNSYYKVVYEMLKNKDWEDLLTVLFADLNKNPEIPENIDKKYQTKFNFEEDAQSENLNIYTKKIYSENGKIVIEFADEISFNPKNEEYEFNIILKNKDFDDVVFDSSYIKDNTAYIPADSINFGDNILCAQYISKKLNKKYLMKSVHHKTFNFDDFDIDTARTKTGFLRITKRNKGYIEFEVEDIKLEEDKFILKGKSNKKVEKLILNDTPKFYSNEYPINYTSDDLSFSVEIDYNDFLKFPIKKFELGLNEDFNKINSTKEYEFFKQNFIISTKNYGNKIKIEFNKYNIINKINKLENNISKLEKSNKKIMSENKKLERTLKNYKSRKIVRIADKLQTIIKI